jgi:hypothetical protein
MELLSAIVFIIALVASCKPKGQICATTLMRDLLIIDGNDTCTIITYLLFLKNIDWPP